MTGTLLNQLFSIVMSFGQSMFAYFPIPPPPIEAEGEWVSREEFISTGRKKSFGFFKCGRCHKTWVSAHAQPVFTQGCKSCEWKSRPILLWKNAEHNRSNQHSEKLNKPHDVKRCQACERGVCTRYQSSS
eukprot:TRINITY_DN2597_c0_g1_i1.p1 TRINITY_DN2597_c0_g1~~TRINITY_DN2597_c0_g1_i1.p1  ORF type:complete len:130 (+),score=6.21 TRINITY_DN2597_c0_g1_i1:132-521(+)